MSTRSKIIRPVGDGKYKGIYVHFDGYPEGVGKVLAEHYATLEQVDRLLALGDMSVLGEIPEDDPNLWRWDVNYSSNKCCTYRGRGETDVDARVGELNEFLDEDYAYLFENGGWTVFEYGEYAGRLDRILKER